MSAQPSSFDRPCADQLAALRAQLAQAQSQRGPVLAFGIEAIDSRLGAGGIDGAGLHEITATSPTLGDDAAATLFVAGLAARFAPVPGANVAWALILDVGRIIKPFSENRIWQIVRERPVD